MAKDKAKFLNPLSLFRKEKQKTKTGKAIGIDLGTTNTVFGIKRVYTEILKNEEQEDLTPSCVTQRNGQYIVGRNALAWMKQDPENTIVSIKRFIGRSFDNEEVQKIIKGHKVNYSIKPLSTGTEHSIAVFLNNKEHTPEQMSSLILKKIKQDAEKALGDKVTHAVITIPSYFNDKQKHSTRLAAAMADFKVQRLLPEPTAAAISFGVDQSRDENIHTILVYDFGGGTFDISVLTMAEGQFIEQAKGGDMWIGGNDIDNLLIEHVYDLIQKEHRDLDIRGLIQKLPVDIKNRFLGELHEKAEMAKIELSEKETAFFDILGLLKDDEGGIINIDVEITRADLEGLILPLVERTLQLMADILKGLHFTPELIDRVLLVGGSSCIPLIQRKVKERFGIEKVMVHKKPMLSVAEGAAILSHRLSESYECPGCGKLVSQTDTICNGCGFDLEKYLLETGVVEIVHSAAHDYYIYLENSPSCLLVKKNTPLPIEKTEVFRLVDPNQRLVHMRFFNVVNDVEESIGDLWLGIDKELEKETENEAKDKQGVREVICVFRIDENNIIEVSARMKDHPEIEINRTLSRGNADEKMFLSLEDTIMHVNSTKYTSYVIYDFINRSVSIIKDINKIVDPETGEVNDDFYRRSQQKFDKAKKMLETGTSPLGRINYAKTALYNYREIMKKEDVNSLERVIKRLEEAEKDGTYEETKGLLEDLNSELDKNPLLSIFMGLNKAYCYYKDRNPSKAERFLNYESKMHECFERSDMYKFDNLLNEIMPEVLEVQRLEANEAVRIEKGITK